MSSHSDSHTDAPDASHAEHHHPNYVKIWAILVVLLVVSVTGPMLEIRIITLLTAFGIAIIKAYLVAKHFMHLDIERPVVVKLLFVCLGLMLLFFTALSPDIMKHWGANWTNVSAKNANIPEVAPHHAPAHDAPAHDAPAHDAPAAHGAGEAH